MTDINMNIVCGPKKLFDIISLDTMKTLYEKVVVGRFIGTKKVLIKQEEYTALSYAVSEEYTGAFIIGWTSALGRVYVKSDNELYLVPAFLS